MMMMRNSSAAAAAVEDDGRLLFVKLQGQNADGSSYLYLRGMSPARFYENSIIINLPSFNGSGMGGSCEGGLFYLDDCEGKGVLFNPMIGEFKFLPPSHVPRPPKANRVTCSACGFGFDSVSNDYKVIRFVDSCFKGVGYGNYEGLWALGVQVEIYSLRSNRWEAISGPNLPGYTPGIVSGSGLYVNGKCYWITYRARCRVFAFDFEKESFSYISLPPNFKDDSDCLVDLHEYKGSLAAIWYERSGLERCFEAWVLVPKEEDQLQASWEKLFDVTVPGSNCTTLGFGKNGGLLFLEGKVWTGVNHDYGTTLLEYDVINGNFRHLPIFDPQGSMKIFSYSILDTTFWLPDSDFANPVTKEGIIKGIEIVPSDEEEDEDEDEGIKDEILEGIKGIEIFHSDEEGVEEGMEIFSCVESAV